MKALSDCGTDEMKFAGLVPDFYKGRSVDSIFINPAKWSGKHCKFSDRGFGQSSGHKHIFVHFELRN